MTDLYSPTWYELFLDLIPPTQTAHEIDFLIRQLPDPPYHNLLDVCCGSGRHAQPLAEQGYQVTGMDINPRALANAGRCSADNPFYLIHDMRQIASLSGTFDAIVCLWQSFGYFAETINQDILRQMRAKLNPHGRLVLDTPNVAASVAFLSNIPANDALNATDIASPKRKP